MNQIKENGIEVHKLFGSYLYYPILPNTNDIYPCPVPISKQFIRLFYIVNYLN